MQYIHRKLENELRDCLRHFAAVAVLGPRQCGKSTLAKAFLSKIPESEYLDLERPSDLRKLAEPELFFELHNDKLICLDEIQRFPNIFPVLRSVIDERKRRGQFLILGSASRDLIRQSSETLAGRIAFLDLTPFLLSELTQKRISIHRLWLRGGFPESLLARTDRQSFRWRENFIRTFLERDLPSLGVRIPASPLQQIWTMCSHSHGRLLNQSQLGQALGLSHTTVRSYIDLLAKTFMLRVLPPFLPNLKKRLIKSPRVYVRDSGILHALLDIESADDLLGHPVRGASWEGLIIENVLGEFPGWRGSFYRSATGAEIDLLIEKGRKRIAIECKASAAPVVTQGFWNALQDTNAQEAWIIAPVKAAYPIAKNVTVSSLSDFLKTRKPHVSG
jgi:hypothetical protein